MSGKARKCEGRANRSLRRAARMWSEKDVSVSKGWGLRGGRVSRGCCCGVVVWRRCCGVTLWTADHVSRMAREGLSASFVRLPMNFLA